jgi:DNA-binding transcriptional ArsR family regulator
MFLVTMTVFTLETRDDLLGVRFAFSPLWETQAAVQALGAESGHGYHAPWRRMITDRPVRVDLRLLHAILPRGGYVPDFLTPPPTVPCPRLVDQLRAVRVTPPDQARRELARCRDSVDDVSDRRIVERLAADPRTAPALLAVALERAWNHLVAPFWPRIRALLEHDIAERARLLAAYGLRRVLDELHPKIRWTRRGVTLPGCGSATVDVGTRGLILMPSAFLWPHLAAIVDEPWIPTIAYPVNGIASLWQATPTPPQPIARLLGRRRALVLASLERPTSTTTLAAALGLTPAGASRHLIALRDAGLVTANRHGHEVRYERTALGNQLLQGPATPY